MSDESSIAPLTDDQHVVALRHLKEAAFACSSLHEALGRSKSVQGMAEAALRVAEHSLAEAGKLLGVATASEAQIEQRSADIRRANLRARELERQLGESVSPKHMTAYLKRLSEKLKWWWRHHGLGHVSELRFTDWGAAEVTFSCALYGAYSYSQSKTPVSDRLNKAQWFEKLAAMGLDLVQEEDSRDSVLVDSEATRRALFGMILGQLPSGRISETRNRFGRNGVSELMDVRVDILDLEDLLKLPSEPATGDSD